MQMQRNAEVVALAMLASSDERTPAHAGTPMSDRVSVAAKVRAEVNKDLALPYNPAQALADRRIGREACRLPGRPGGVLG